MHLMYYLGSDGKRVYTLKASFPFDMRRHQYRVGDVTFFFRRRNQERKMYILSNHFCLLYTIRISLFHRKKLRKERLRKVLILQDFPPMINSVDSVFLVRKGSESICHQLRKSHYERIKYFVVRERERECLGEFERRCC